jgi:amino acid transporter
VGAAVSILGTNGNTVLAGPRYLFALADDGFGPRALARLHPRFRTPVAAILLQTAIAVPLALNGTFVELAKLSVIARLATYIGTAVAVPFLRRKHPDVEKAVRLPLGPVIPIAATLLCLVLAASARPEQLKMGLYAILLGFLIYAFRREPAGGGGATSA